MKVVDRISRGRVGIVAAAGFGALAAAASGRMSIMKLINKCIRNRSSVVKLSYSCGGAGGMSGQGCQASM